MLSLLLSSISEKRGRHRFLAEDDALQGTVKADAFANANAAANKVVDACRVICAK
jgi:hypothetical protein